jgi:hypothetical protein
MKTVLQPESPSWSCEHCQAPQYQPRRIYAVSLCYLCMAQRADQPGMAHYAECRLYGLERENKRLLQLVTRLIGRTEQTDGPSEPLNDRVTKLSAIAFAALIHKFGKPIHVEKALIDALPDHFSIFMDDVGESRKFWVELDTDIAMPEKEEL